MHKIAVGSMQRKCSISILHFFVQDFVLCVTFSISGVSSFIMHTTHMCSLAIPAYKTIRMTTTYTNCVHVYSSVCRRLTKQKFKYHLRLKWKTGWQQQQQHRQQHQHQPPNQATAVSYQCFV